MNSKNRFNEGQKRVLLLTERFLFYYPYWNAMGAENVVFYGCPDYVYTYLHALQWMLSRNTILDPEELDSECSDSEALDADEEEGNTSTSTKNRSSEVNNSTTKKVLDNVNKLHTSMVLTNGKEDSYALERLVGTKLIPKILQAKLHKMFVFNRE